MFWEPRPVRLFSCRMYLFINVNFCTIWCTLHERVTWKPFLIIQDLFMYLRLWNFNETILSRDSRLREKKSVRNRLQMCCHREKKCFGTSTSTKFRVSGNELIGSIFSVVFKTNHSDAGFLRWEMPYLFSFWQNDLNLALKPVFEKMRTCFRGPTFVRIKVDVMPSLYDADRLYAHRRTYFVSSK